jgi:hypothetical protein
MIPNHWLHIYEKPTVGTASLQRKLAYSYRHQISANGWFDTASCDLRMTPIEAEIALENYVGNPVKIFVDNPAQPIWEGIITTVAYDCGGVLIRRSIDSMANRAEVVIQKANNALGSQTIITNAANLIPSQDVYGIKESSLDAYVVEGTNLVPLQGYTHSVRDTLIAINGWPQSSITQGRNINVHLEMKGYYHTLDWEMYWNATSLSKTASNLITTILTAITNTDLWFDYADTSGIETNAAFTINQQIRIGMTKWQALQRITEAGNGTGAYFIVGIEPTNFTTGTRRLYYRQANGALEYTAKAKDSLRVRNASGGLVRPWTVIPDRILRITDILTGWNAQGDDPRDVYLRSIQYDADQQSIRWQGSDNTTGEGIFQVKTFFQRHDNKWSTTKWRTNYT